MAFYPDLSDYEYWKSEAKMKNVGWLSAEHAINRGPTHPLALHKLKKKLDNPQNLMRGTHLCEFCKMPTEVRRFGERCVAAWESIRSGNGEIHIDGKDGIRYSAPVLIVHYIAEHQYQPPQEFIEAVIAEE